MTTKKRDASPVVTIGTSAQYTEYKPDRATQIAQARARAAQPPFIAISDKPEVPKIVR